MKKLTTRFSLIAAMILVAALSRLLPHPDNFTPVGAMALFGAAHFSDRKWAFFVPAVSLWISDLILNNVVYKAYYPEFTLLPGTLLTTYLPVALIAILGMILLEKVSVGKLLVASVSSSVLFFVVSNFFVWYGSTQYPSNAVGLVLCYEAGLPFFRNSLIGDLCYVALLFGTFELAQRRFPKLAIQ